MSYKEFKMHIDKNTPIEINVTVSGTQHLSMLGNTIFIKDNDIQLPDNCIVNIIVNGNCKEIYNANNISIIIYGTLQRLYKIIVNSLFVKENIEIDNGD